MERNIDREYYHAFGTLGGLTPDTTVSATDTGYWASQKREDKQKKRRLLMYLGKRIKDAVFDDNTVRLKFSNNTWLVISDGGQSCCEHRYMTNDGDDIRQWIGAKFFGVSVVGAESGHSDYDIHDIQFLRIGTDCGVMCFSNHNEHNGYYGGFDINVSIIDA